MLLASKQNIAPHKKMKKGHLVIGWIIRGATMFTTSYFTPCCNNETSKGITSMEVEQANSELEEPLPKHI
jgi:hypothetical protein